MGGISEERRIARAAEAIHGIRFIPHGLEHGGRSGRGPAPGFRHSRHRSGGVTGSPFIDEITVGGWKLDADGMLPIPTKAGLGLTLDPDVVAKYTGKARLLEKA